MMQKVDLVDVSDNKIVNRANVFLYLYKWTPDQGSMLLHAAHCLSTETVDVTDLQDVFITQYVLQFLCCNTLKFTRAGSR